MQTRQWKQKNEVKTASNNQPAELVQFKSLSIYCRCPFYQLFRCSCCHERSKGGMRWWKWRNWRENPRPREAAFVEGYLAATSMRTWSEPNLLSSSFLSDVLYSLFFIYDSIKILLYTVKNFDGLRCIGLYKSVERFRFNFKNEQWTIPL